MFQLDLKSGLPICDQIVNGFIKLKTLGILKSGDKLPSVRTLASKFSVNPNTVQKSYAILEAEGIIYSIKGKGSFISDDESVTKAILTSAENEFSQQVRHFADLGLGCKKMITIVKENFTEGENGIK